MSQAQLAREMAIPKSTISAILAGRRGVRKANALAFGVGVDHFVNWASLSAPGTEKGDIRLESFEVECPLYALLGQSGLTFSQGMISSRPRGRRVDPCRRASASGELEAQAVPADGNGGR